MKYLYTRLMERDLKDALVDSPIALIHGPRQCGKTTLAQKVGKLSGYLYMSMDDAATLSHAENDPVGFVNSLPQKVILDEAQKAPHLFSQIKWVVDSERAARRQAAAQRRFVLTGSVNILHVQGLSDSLAGRMEIIRMHPLSQAELARKKPNFLDALFGAQFPPRWQVRPLPDLVERVVVGGYPAALRQPRKDRRAKWYAAYLEAIANTDAFTISRIRSVEDLPQLLAAAAVGTAQPLNVERLATHFARTRPTIKEYIYLLERLFLLERVPPWHTNRSKRFIKTPKLHLADTGLACALLRADAKTLKADRTLLGQLLETFVFGELRKQADAHPSAHDFYHYRDKDGVEVDMVIQQSVNAVAGVEVKLAATVLHSDFVGLRRLRASLGRRFAGGAVIYTGDKLLRFGEDLFAVPIQRLWKVL